MKCYICAKEGKSSDAVAVCIVCRNGALHGSCHPKRRGTVGGRISLPGKEISEKDAPDPVPECFAALRRSKLCLPY